MKKFLPWWGIELTTPWSWGWHSTNWATEEIFMKLEVLVNLTSIFAIMTRPEGAWPNLSSNQAIRANLVYIVSLVGSSNYTNFLNPHWHELWKQEKCSSTLGPTVNRKFPVNSNGRMERLLCNFHYLGYYCSPNLSIRQKSTQKPSWNFLVTLLGPRAR